MRINEQSEMGPNRSVARAFPGGPEVKTLCSLQGRSRAADVENGLVDLVGEGEGGQIEKVALMYIHHHV